MPVYKVYVTRDASVTYVAKIEAASVEDLEERCSRTGLTEKDLGKVEWKVDSTISYDDVENYRITEEIIKEKEGVLSLEEITHKEWSL